MPRAKQQTARAVRARVIRRPHARLGWRATPRIVAAVLAVTSVGACASSPAPVPMPMVGATSSVYLTVQNDNYWDATIHANWGGLRERLGLVTGKTTQTFAFGWRRDDVQFDVRFIGDGGWRSEVVFVHPGDSLALMILPGPTGRKGPGLP